MIATATVGSPAAVAALEPEWWDLWAAAPEATPFQSPAWLLPWWEAFRPGRLRVVTVRMAERLVALAPLYLAEDRLLPLGISLSDYVDLLVAPNQGDAVAEAFARHIGQEPGWTEWVMPELRDQAAAWGLPLPPSCHEERHAGAGCAVLALDRDAVPKLQRRKHRMALNRARRRGEIEFLRAHGGSLPHLLDEFLRLHRLRWNGGVLADERVATFLRSAVPRLDAAGLLRLYAVRIGGVIAGAYLGFQHRDRVYAWLGGFDPGFAFESPGTLLIGHAIAEARREGAGVLDFLRGDEPYKFAWGCTPVANGCRVIRRSEVHAAI